MLQDCGIPIGHPLHGKYQPPRPQRQSQEYKPNRTVNMATTQESSSAQLNNPSVSARIDLLQNQLNQVLMMMQNNQKDTVHASTDPKWIDAMTKEINALESNGTWTLTTLPTNKIPIGCKWVYRIKYFTDGASSKPTQPSAYDDAEQSEGHSPWHLFFY
ncbi:uncharacterized mitochondrial protein-like protein [Tanacetum coccineum]